MHNEKLEIWTEFPLKVKETPWYTKTIMPTIFKQYYCFQQNVQTFKQSKYPIQNNHKNINIQDNSKQT